MDGRKEGRKETEGRWREVGETNEQVFWYVELQSLATVFERSSNPLRPCFAGDENFRVFIHDDDDGPREVVTFFQRHSPFSSSPRRVVSSCLFISPRTTAANVSSSKQFFENTFGALKVAPFPPLPPVHETKDAARRPCFSPNGNTVTRLPWVCACMCAKFANARCVVVATREGEKMEG